METPRSKTLWTRIFMREASVIAEEIKADAILFYMDSTRDISPFLNFKSNIRFILLSRRPECIEKASRLPVSPVLIPDVTLTRAGYLKVGFLSAVSKGLLTSGDTVVCVGGVPDQGCMDTLMIVEISMESELFAGHLALEFPEEIKPEVFETLLGIVLELANEGREGKPVGGLFVIGDHENVLKLSRQMVFNPFQGYTDESRNISATDVRESLKEFSAIDGAFIVRGDGVVLAAGRHLNVVYQGPGLTQGLGTRHASGAAITGVTNSIAMVISESTGKVTLFRNGQNLTTIDRGIVSARSGPRVD